MAFFMAFFLAVIIFSIFSALTYQSFLPCDVFVRVFPLVVTYL